MPEGFTPHSHESFSPKDKQDFMAWLSNYARDVRASWKHTKRDLHESEESKGVRDLMSYQYAIPLNNIGIILNKKYENEFTVTSKFPIFLKTFNDEDLTQDTVNFLASESAHALPYNVRSEAYRRDADQVEKRAKWNNLFHNLAEAYQSIAYKTTKPEMAALLELEAKEFSLDAEQVSQGLYAVYHIIRQHDLINPPENVDEHELSPRSDGISEKASEVEWNEYFVYLEVVISKLREVWHENFQARSGIVNPAIEYVKKIIEKSEQWVSEDVDWKDREAVISRFEKNLQLLDRIISFRDTEYDSGGDGADS